MIRFCISAAVAFVVFAWFSPEAWVTFLLAVLWLHLDEWLEMKGSVSNKTKRRHGHN